MNDTQMPDGREGVRNEKNINDVIKYAPFIMMALLVAIISQTQAIGLFRGVVEIILALASLLAYQRSRSDMIQNVTLFAFVILLLMGIYDIYLAIG